MTRKEEYRYMQKAFKNVPRHKVCTNNNGYVMTLFKTDYNFEPYCLKFSEIENYEKAKADNFINWDCHHRLEEKYTRKELIAKGLYYNRMPSELIFLPRKEHMALHRKIDKKKGMSHTKGHHWKLSKEYCESVSKRFKSYVWVTNGKINKRVLPNNIPEGFYIGRLKHGHSNLKGKKWIIGIDGKRQWINGGVK